MIRKFKRLLVLLEITLKGHIFNYFWRSRKVRQDVRSALIESKLLENYLKEYIQITLQIPTNQKITNNKDEKIFSIWFQGEENAPPLVKSCFKSIRNHCKQELIVLDDKNIFDYINLPATIIKKYKSGKIRRAHFADICRVELLYKYGGFWLDASCFVTSPIPKSIVDQDFFVYLTGNICTFSFIQNCFIRAKKGSYLLKCWREIIIDYWTHENRTVNYFMHQLLFKSLIVNNTFAKKFFDKMLHINQDPTHVVYYKYADKQYNKNELKQITKGSFFQKCCHHADNIAKPNSYLDFILNYYNKNTP